MYRIIFTDYAIEDLKIVKEWYENRQKGLGNQFADYVFKSIGAIKKHPSAFPSKHKNTREMYIGKYPYMIIYSIEEKIIFLLRIFPCKNSPKKKYRN